MTSQELRRHDVSTEPENIEAKKEYQRFYIFARLQLDEGIYQIHSDLSKLFGGESLGYLTCTRRAREFANGREAVEDKHRSGAPKSVKSENTIESNLGLSYGTVQTILLEDLTLKKVCARWIPHILTEN